MRLERDEINLLWRQIQAKIVRLITSHLIWDGASVKYKPHTSRSLSDSQTIILCDFVLAWWIQLRPIEYKITLRPRSTIHNWQTFCSFVLLFFIFLLPDFFPNERCCCPLQFSNIRTIFWQTVLHKWKCDMTEFLRHFLVGALIFPISCCFVCARN